MKGRGRGRESVTCDGSIGGANPAPLVCLTLVCLVDLSPDLQIVATVYLIINVIEIDR